jgi:hypothetical protein
MTTPQQSTSKPVETMWLHLKAPVEFFERIDRWCQQVKERDGTVMAPNRSAAIRWIVHNFLLKQEQRAPRKRRKVKSR